MDPISDIIALLRPHAAFSKSISGKGEWGVSYAAYKEPGFAIILRGRCWLAVEGGASILLERGDFVLFPSTPAFTLCSRPGAGCVPGVPSTKDARHGAPDGDPDFEMLGGAFRLDPANASLILSLLPEMIHIRGGEEGMARLGRIIDLILDECAADRPGKDMVLQWHIDVLLVECLRRPSVMHGALPTGLAAALQDTALARGLRALHADAGGDWSVAKLAKLAGMSRSAFSAHFSRCLGCGPMEYLLRWRMALAQDALCRGRISLDRLAEEIGYKSASAFSTAFRRQLGLSPGAYARSGRLSHAEPVQRAAVDGSG